MTIALDIGADCLRSLRVQDGRLVGRSSRSVYAVLSDSPAQRELLRQGRIPFASCEENLILLGDAATELSQVFHVPTRPLLPEGRLPQDDAFARQVLGALIDRLLPAVERAGQICCLTLPAADRDTSSRAGDLVAFVTQVLRLRGYQPMILGSAMGVVLAELGSVGFTGVGMVFGASHSEAVVVHHGIEMARCEVALGGSWIDEQLAQSREYFLWDSAGRQYLDVPRAAALRTAVSLNVVSPNHAEVRGYFHELARSLMAELAQTLRGNSAATMIPQPLKVVASGAAARINGFDVLLQQVLRETELPVEIGSIRVAVDSNYNVARGCLIGAQLENDARSREADGPPAQPLTSAA
ncbi:MAG: hypothetical protein CMJ48_09645 [Planctomycetaceae bacterium]|nr:hypothetical protein [Planctomycetaceae bacterium]